MPQRIHLREMQGGIIAGTPIVVSVARGGEVIAFAATIDSDGLMESIDDCRQFALRFREKLDNSKAGSHPAVVDKNGILGKDAT